MLSLSGSGQLGVALLTAAALWFGSGVLRGRFRSEILASVSRHGVQWSLAICVIVLVLVAFGSSGVFWMRFLDRLYTPSLLKAGAGISSFDWMVAGVVGVCIALKPAEDVFNSIIEGPSWSSRLARAVEAAAKLFVLLVILPFLTTWLRYIASFFAFGTFYGIVVGTLWPPKKPMLRPPRGAFVQTAEQAQKNVPIDEKWFR